MHYLAVFAVTFHMLLGCCWHSCPSHDAHARESGHSAITEAGMVEDTASVCVAGDRLERPENEAHSPHAAGDHCTFWRDEMPLPTCALELSLAAPILHAMPQPSAGLILESDATCVSWSGGLPLRDLFGVRLI